VLFRSHMLNTLAIVLLAYLPALNAVPVQFESTKVMQPTVTRVTSKVADFDPLDLARQYCQSRSQSFQCGNTDNCEDWTTGVKSGGSNPGRISCNDQGQFCAGGDCSAGCMDKSPDTKVFAFSYQAVSSQIPMPGSVVERTINNDSPNTITGSFNFSEMIENEYQWTWDVTSSSSVSLESTVDLPDPCSQYDRLSTVVSTTAGQAQANTNSKSWSEEFNYSVPPQSTLVMTYTIARTQFTIPFSQTVQFGATVAYWCTNPVSGNNFWMPSAASVMDQSLWCSGSVCTFTGTFTGTQGVSDEIDTRICPLNVQC